MSKKRRIRELEMAVNRLEVMVLNLRERMTEQESLAPRVDELETAFYGMGDEEFDLPAIELKGAN